VEQPTGDRCPDLMQLMGFVTSREEGVKRRKKNMNQYLSDSLMVSLRLQFLAPLG
jgi:hypothetical protein